MSFVYGEQIKKTMNPIS